MESKVDTILRVLSYAGSYFIVGYVTGFVLLTCMKTGVVDAWHKGKSWEDKNREEVWGACLPFWPYIHLKYFFLTIFLAPEKLTEWFCWLFDIANKEPNTKKPTGKSVTITGDTLLKVHKLLGVLELMDYTAVSDVIVKQHVLPKMKDYHEASSDEKRKLTIEVKKDVAEVIEDLLDLSKY